MLTVGVEDTDDTDVHAVLMMEAVCERLGDTLALVVASTNANGVHMSPAATRIYQKTLIQYK